MMTTQTHVNWSSYDFVDFGCSRGGSIQYCQKRFGARRGLGIDRDIAKVEQARSAGFEAIQADPLDLPEEAQVRFVAMLDFLEHLPNLHAVETTIHAASLLASDFLFIRHPSFEGEAYLSKLGLRQYWWYWTGHPAHIRVSDFCTMFDRLGLQQYLIRYHESIEDSAHPSILPTGLPRNQHAYDADRHGPKPFIQFAEPVWRSQEIFVALKPFKPSSWEAITRPL